MSDVIELLAKALKQALEIVCIALMLVMMVSLFLLICGRYVPLVPPFMWTLEVINLCLIWMIFTGASIGVAESRHFFVDVFHKVTGKTEKVMKVITYSVLYVVTFVFIIYGYGYFRDWGLIQESDLTGLNMGWVYASVPLNGLCWLIFLTANVIQEINEQKP